MTSQGREPVPAGGDAARGENSAAATRHRHRRVIALSERDRQRAAEGIDVFAPQTPVEEEHSETASGRDPREEDILREVPPHWNGGRG